MAENFSNNFATTLGAAAAAGDTTITVASSTGAPAPNFRILVGSELMLVTAVSGTTWTVTRGVEGTTAAAHALGAAVTHILTALALTTAISEGAGGTASEANARIPAGQPWGTLEREYTFDTTVEGWTTSGAGTLSSTGGRLRYVGSAGDQIQLEPSSAANVADGEVQADVVFVDAASDNNGLFFRASSATDGYLVAVREASLDQHLAGSASLFKIVAGAYTEITTGSRTTVPTYFGQPVRVLIRFVGSKITVFLNETAVLQATDTTFTTGRVGTYVGAAQTHEWDNVRVYSLPSGTTEAPKLALPAGAGNGWEQEVNESGASLANWTINSGTWTTDGTIITAALTVNANDSLTYTRKVPFGAGVIYEAEMRFPTTGQGTGADVGGGLVLGTTAAGDAGGLAVQLFPNRALEVQVERSQQLALNSWDAAVPFDTWHKLRIVVGSLWVSVYLNGTLLGTARVDISGLTDQSHIGLRSFNSLLNFRNIKAWVIGDETTAGSAGPALDKGYESLWKPPALSYAEDDRFDDTTLATKWAVVRGTPDLAALPGWVFLNGADIQQPVPAGDWSVITEVMHGDNLDDADYGPKAYLYLSDSATITGNQRAFIVHPRVTLNAHWAVAGESFVNGAYSAALFTNVDILSPYGQRVFLRIVKTGTTYRFDVSHNGFTWYRFAVTTALGITPTHFGIGCHVGGAYYNTFLRR